MRKQIVVIYDGPDMCGKTEQARELSRILEIPYFKNTGEWEAFEKSPEYFANAMKYGDDYFYRFLRDTGVSCVLDRSYPSEWVYSKVYGRKTFDDALSYVDKLASSFGVKIIIPYRETYAGIKDNMHEINEHDLMKIHSCYMKFVEWTSCETLLLPVDDEDLNREINETISFLGVK